MPIITPERAGEIRGQLTEQYGATWLHEYHKAIEAEVLAALASDIADAKRYRWLRDTNNTRCNSDEWEDFGPAGTIDTIMISEGDGLATSLSPEEFDAAIDASVAKEST